MKIAFDLKPSLYDVLFLWLGDDRKLSGAQVSAVLERARKQDKERIRVKDKADRATIEQVMDPRTRMILFKMLNRGFISEINGCISTGKEANGKTVIAQNFSDISPMILFFQFITARPLTTKLAPSRSTKLPFWCSKTATNT